MFLRPHITGNCPWATLDRSLAARADAVAEQVERILDAHFAADRFDALNWHAIVAGFIARHPGLLAFSEEPAPELLVRVKAMMLAQKLADPNSLPSLKESQA